jgi:hypothetical protein
MNSAADLHARLLKLFPVKVVKEQFETDATIQAEMLPEIVERYPVEAIRSFMVDKIGMTRQHTYFFRLGSKFDRRQFDFNELNIEVVSELHQGTNYIFFCLPIVQYHLAMYPAGDLFTLDLYQPTRIVFNGRDLVIQVTILERSATTFIDVPKDQRLFEIKRTNLEENFIENILTVIRKSNTVSVCDINKGMKAVWAADAIDATSVSYRKDKSMTTESMDEQYTVKQHMPEAYKDMITRPLGRTIFKPTDDKANFSRNFWVDPSKGILRTSTYPVHPDQTWNIINEILRNNG